MEDNQPIHSDTLTELLHFNIDEKYLEFYRDINSYMSQPELIEKYQDLFDSFTPANRINFIVACLPFNFSQKIVPQRVNLIQHLLQHSCFDTSSEQGNNNRFFLITQLMSEQIPTTKKISTSPYLPQYEIILNLFSNTINVDTLNKKTLNGYCLLDHIVWGIDAHLWMIKTLKKHGLNINFIGNQHTLSYLFKNLIGETNFNVILNYFLNEDIDLHYVDDRGENLWHKIMDAKSYSLEAYESITDEHFAFMKEQKIDYNLLNYKQENILHKIMEAVQASPSDAKYQINRDLVFHQIITLKPNLKQKDIFGQTAPFKAIKNSSYYWWDTFKRFDIGWFETNSNQKTIFDEAKKIHGLGAFIKHLHTYIPELIEYTYEKIKPKVLDTNVEPEIAINHNIETNDFTYTDEEYKHATQYILSEYPDKKHSTEEYKELIQDLILRIFRPAFENLKKANNIENYPLTQAWMMWINQYPERSLFVLEHIKKLPLIKKDETKDETNTVDSNIQVILQDSPKELSTELTAELYTTQDFDNFEKIITAMGRNPEISNNFIKEAKIEKEKLQIKTFAQSETLLSQISILKDTFPHFIEVINHIENYCILQKAGNGVFYFPPLLLAGSPGIGKTFFCHTMAEIINTYFHVFNMESMTSNFQMTGISEGWGTASPGQIFTILKNEPKINPIFLLDELDKCLGDERFSPTHALLPLLEQYTASKFKDECISLPINASHCVWVATANELERISAPLLSRFDVFTVPTPNYSERKTLINGIYKSIIKNNSWGHHFNQSLPEEVLNLLAEDTSPGAARYLRRTITKACSMAIRDNRFEIFKQDIDQFTIETPMIWDSSLDTLNYTPTDLSTTTQVH